MQMRLESISVSRLLRPIAADRHAAPASPMAPCMVGEQEGAGGAFAGLNVGKVLSADEPRQRLPDREQKCVRVAPAAKHLELERPLPHWRRGDPAKDLVALEETIQGRQLVKSLGGQRAALMLTHEAPEPFPEASRLFRGLVELARQPVRSHVPEHVARRQVGMLKPAKISLAVIDPIDGAVDRRCDRIEEIEAG